MGARYKLIYKPEHPNAKANGQVYEHIFIMSEILGRALADQEVVHHDDNDSRNNSPKNLILFASDAEHQAYHRRERAFKMSGNSSFMKCRYCKAYDDPAVLQQGKNTYQVWHKNCAAKAYKERINGN